MRASILVACASANKLGEKRGDILTGSVLPLSHMSIAKCCMQDFVRLRSSCINAFVVGLSWTAAPILSTVGKDVGTLPQDITLLLGHIAATPRMQDSMSKLKKHLLILP